MSGVRLWAVRLHTEIGC